MMISRRKLMAWLGLAAVVPSVPAMAVSPTGPPAWSWDRINMEMAKGHVYAHAGDLVTCENGHIICAFTKTVNYGDMFDPAAMSYWHQPEPKIGTMKQPCLICGTDWFRGMNLHFADGWR